MKRFIDKNIVVTGGARGLGKGIAKRFVKEGASVCIMDNLDNDSERVKELETTVEELTAYAKEVHDDKTQRVYGFQGDVSKSHNVIEFSNFAYEKMGRVDVVIGNAGVAYEGPFLEIPEEEWDKVINTNLKGIFLTCQAFGKKMKDDSYIRENGGSIILMGSKVSKICEPGYAHYCASKAGILSLTQSLAVELGPYNINVNSVAPGYIVTPLSEQIDSPEFVERFKTNLIPLQRPGRIDDVVGAFAFLASEDARFINGEILYVDGGQTSFHGFLDYKDKGSTQ